MIQEESVRSELAASFLLSHPPPSNSQTSIPASDEDNNQALHRFRLRDELVLRQCHIRPQKFTFPTNFSNQTTFKSATVHARRSSLSSYRCSKPSTQRGVRVPSPWLHHTPCQYRGYRSRRIGRYALSVLGIA
eukprot:2603523-Rhodomonas_salina.1